MLTMRYDSSLESSRTCWASWTSSRRSCTATSGCALFRFLARFLSPEAADHSSPCTSSHSRLLHNLTGHCFPCEKQSGNARFSRSRSQPIIFDPASYYGHSEADLGIMHMFGGFTPAFFTRYHQLVPRSEPREEYEQRVQLYEAYHHLNHALMFGVRFPSPLLA